MITFLKETISWEQFELLIDKNIFPKDIVLKSAYNFLDKWYFFFKFDSEKNLILQFTKKSNITDKPKNIIWNFSDSLLETTLRDKLEKDNKKIRETIVKRAINGPLDTNNFVCLDTDQSGQNQINFDKDIDEILKEIENDPDLKIDEEEIEKILKEIEEESSEDIQKPKILVNKDAIKEAKKNFKKKK